MVDRERAPAAVLVDQPPGALRRVARLWRLYAAMDLMWLSRDLRSVITYLISDATLAVAAVTGTVLLAERFDGIGHWSKPQVLFMLGYGLILNGLTDMFFNWNVSHISRRVGRGQWDHTLVQPQPIVITLLTEGFAPVSGSMALYPAVGLLAWAITHGAARVSPGWLALLGLNLLASTAVAMAFAFLWGSLAFWAPRAAEEINSSSWRLLDGLKTFPLDGVAPVLLGTLLTAVPVGFVAWYPCRALLGLDHAPYALLLTPLAAAVFTGCAAWLFQKGMAQYGRTGSQRYLSFGHRR